MKTSFLILVCFLVACSEKKKESKPAEDHGVVKSYRADGKLFSEITMMDGKRNGIARNYYSNGKISEEGTYKDDKKDGVYKLFYEDGTLMKETEYKENQLNGWTKKYRADGTQAWQAKFENDMPCANLVEYYLNGTKKTDYPTIVFEPVDRLKELGEFTLKMHLSDRSSVVTFYQGQLTPSGCFDESKTAQVFSEKKGEGRLDYDLGPGGFRMEEIKIIAVVKTVQGNKYITTATYNLAINN